jgi:hypothetical protein
MGEDARVTKGHRACHQSDSRYGQHPERVHTCKPGRAGFLANAALQAATEPDREFEQAIVSIQLDNIAGTVEHSCTVLALREMSLHRGT